MVLVLFVVCVALCLLTADLFRVVSFSCFYCCVSWILSSIASTLFGMKDAGSCQNTLFFLFLLKNIDCGYSLKPPRRGGSNEYPRSLR